jgi:hypothetical protein
MVCSVLFLLYTDLLAAGLPIKCSPMDIEAFRQETAIKYPTFMPPASNPVSTQEAELKAPTTILKLPPPTLIASRLAEAYSPIPVRHHYHHDSPADSYQHGLHGQNTNGLPFHPHQQQQQQPYRATPQPATPAPTPPQSPKPKKQQYQTDQGRPFLFPFSKSELSSSGHSNMRLVPFAVDEADALYNRHMYISLALGQMWRTREDCMTAESGLKFMPGNEEEVIKSFADKNNVESQVRFVGKVLHRLLIHFHFRIWTHCLMLHCLTPKLPKLSKR